MVSSPWTRFLTWPLRRRQRQLAAARPSLGEAGFCEAIVSAGGDALAAPRIRSRLMVLREDPDFTPYPEDSLLKVFGLAEEDLDEDLILALLEELGLKPPDPPRVLAFGEIDTPLRVALFVTLTRSLQ